MNPTTNRNHGLAKSWSSPELKFISTMNHGERSLIIHEQLRGKIG
ncbi:MAG: hypothetical protein ACI9ZV_000316, partial [Candidatus Azotimanducaceae bacterium]